MYICSLNKKSIIESDIDEKCGKFIDMFMYKVALWSTLWTGHTL